MRKKLDEHGNLQLKTYALLSLSTMARVNAVANIKWRQIENVSALLNHNSTETTLRFYIKEDKSKVIKLKDEFGI